MSIIVTIAGGPSGSSSSDALLSHVTRRIVQAGHTVNPLVLRELPPAALVSGDFTDDLIAEAVALIESADAIVIVSPIYQASDSGLLELFLDLLPQFALRRKSLLPFVTGGTSGHAPAVDNALRRVLYRLGAAHVGQGRFVLASHLRVFPDGGVIIDPASAGPVAEVTDHFLAGLRGVDVPPNPLPPNPLPPNPLPRNTSRVSPNAGEPDLIVRRVGVGDLELKPLLDDLMVEYGTRYARVSPYTQLTEVPSSDFRLPNGVFLILAENDETVAGGAIRRYDEQTAEVKRVWTSSAHRRRGLARRLMSELEFAARQLGYTRIHLTTGPRQPEAVQLYLSAGYLPRFDPDVDPETIGPLAFGKELIPGAGMPAWDQPSREQVLAARAQSAQDSRISA